MTSLIEIMAGIQKRYADWPSQRESMGRLMLRTAPLDELKEYGGDLADRIAAARARHQIAG